MGKLVKGSDRRRYGYSGIRYLGEVDRVMVGGVDGGILVVDTGMSGGWCRVRGGVMDVGYMGLVGIGGGRRVLDVGYMVGLMGGCNLLVMEDVGLIYGVSKATAYSMGKQVGLWQGLGEGMGLGVRVIGSREWHGYVRWRYGGVVGLGDGGGRYGEMLGRGMKGTKVEGVMVGEYLMGLYGLDVVGERVKVGGWDGVCDAVCMMDYVMWVLGIGGNGVMDGGVWSVEGGEGYDRLEYWDIGK